MDIGSFVGYKYPTYVETEQYTWIGFSNPTFQSFPNFCNVWTSAFSCRIPVSDLRRNRKIHVGRILESDISIIPEFSQYVNIGFFRRIQVSDLRRNRKIHVGRILESDIPIIPEFSQYVDIGFFVGYQYPTYVETEQFM